MQKLMKKLIVLGLVAASPLSYAMPPQPDRYCTNAMAENYRAEIEILSKAQLNVWTVFPDGSRVAEGTNPYSYKLKYKKKGVWDFKAGSGGDQLMGTYSLEDGKPTFDVKTGSVDGRFILDNCPPLPSK